ncbi:MAG: ROK family protein [Candidatus Omnitrophica bacterium]|nr:ROK family protein [Candidatus Omnitrophota bacterium]
MAVFLGIDWGGTYIKAGLVSPKGVVVKERIYQSADLRKKTVFIQNLKSLLKDFKGFSIKGLGIGAPGIIDTKKGFIYYLPNIPGWKNFPLKEVLIKQLKLPVAIGNDANLFGLAEARCGAGRGFKQAIFLTLGTGLGGAVLIDGKLLTGRTSAAELGHVPLTLKGNLCGCGARGCIETYTGNGYLLKRYRQLKGNKTKIKEVSEIFQRGLKGEKQAIMLWKEFSYNLGKFLSGMVNVFNPEAIILGGGVSGALGLFRPYLLQVIRQQAMWPQVKNLKVLKAQLKQPGIVGAALLVKEQLEKQ